MLLSFVLLVFSYYFCSNPTIDSFYANKKKKVKKCKVEDITTNFDWENLSGENEFRLWRIKMKVIFTQ